MTNPEKRDLTIDHPAGLPRGGNRLIGRLLWIAFLFWVGLAAVRCETEVRDGVGSKTQKIGLGGRGFDLELALDDTSRYRGLSDRAQIPPGGGMLFVFPSARVQHFVMRKCLIPIDLIYLDPGGRVLSTHRMTVEPYDTPEYRLTRYTSPWPAQFAIELSGGTLDTLALQTGDRVDLPVVDLKRRAR